jgi:hypothetical protein
MKVAVDDTGSPVRAEAGAPKQALCPQCGGPMILRRRRGGARPGDLTYFWRHQDNTNLACCARFSFDNKVSTNGRRRMK